MFDVLGIGMAMTDKKVRFAPDNPVMQKVLPSKGRYARLGYADFYALSDVPALSIGAGGSVANSLRDLGALGVKSAFIGKIGQDKEGRYFRQSLLDCDVKPVLSAVPGGRSGSCVVLIHDDGEKTVCAKAQAAKTLEETDVDFNLLKLCRVIFIEGYLFDQNPQLVKKLVAEACCCGCRIYLTLADAACVRDNKDLWLEMLSSCDVLFGNEAEFAELSCPENRLPPLCVMTKGAAGCAIWHDNKWQEFAAKPDVRVVNTNGAGDAFAAGFIRGLLTAADIEECVSSGNEVAAAVLSSAESYLQKVVADNIGF